MIAFYEGDIATSRALVEESLSIREEIGDQVYIGWALDLLGVIAHAAGDLAAARSYYEKSLGIWREHHFRLGISAVLPFLGELALDEGNLAGARAYLVEGLAVSRAVGDLQAIASTLEGLAGLAAARHDAARCLRLAGAAAGIREAIGVPGPPDRQARLTRRLAPAREILGERASAAAWAEGQAMTTERAVAYTLEEGAGFPKECSP